ncbi:SafA/ExsA family spore coat assembly protein [Paenalkalicoccus suaedae]|uniref:SafA/ExsA family spore coat assembly protein n=1 Tax=Paenalkalicoccus suaedae TaxID=2592382 RepID=UPI0024BF1757|nr:SafA/ExsA family spore coat assembly protein [Paenalkalicoccus suaedae]
MKIHIVQTGDTLWKLAKKYHVDFEALKAANHHLSNPDLIYPGMKLYIPQGKEGKKEFVKETLLKPAKEVQMPQAKKEAPKKEAPITQAKKEAPKKVAPQAPQPKKKASVQIQAEASWKKEQQVAPPPLPTTMPLPPMPEMPIMEEAPKKEAPKKPVSKPAYEKPKPKPQPQPQPQPPATPYPQFVSPEQMPMWYPVGPMTEGCIPVPVVCGFYPMNMQCQTCRQTKDFREFGELSPDQYNE